MYHISTKNGSVMFVSVETRREEGKKERRREKFSFRDYLRLLVCRGLTNQAARSPNNHRRYSLMIEIVSRNCHRKSVARNDHWAWLIKSGRLKLRVLSCVNRSLERLKQSSHCLRMIGGAIAFFFSTTAPNFILNFHYGNRRLSNQLPRWILTFKVLRNSVFKAAVTCIA